LFPDKIWFSTRHVMQHNTTYLPTFVTLGRSKIPNQLKTV